jgi:hypothetical protein
MNILIGAEQTIGWRGSALPANAHRTLGSNTEAHPPRWFRKLLKAETDKEAVHI